MQDNTRVPEANEIQRFELLRNELKELERRVERSAKHANVEEVYFFSFFMSEINGAITYFFIML